MRLWDKLVSLKNKTQAITARYDAAGMGRALRGWRPPPTGPNAAMSGSAIIRARMQDIARNEWVGSSVARSRVSNIIGTGIVPRFLTKNAALKDRLNMLWKTWVRESDADSVLNFYAQVHLACRAKEVAGEVFVRQRPRRLDDGLAVPMQLQLLESDFVPLLDADSYTGLPAGNIIRSGIEFNRIGRRVAFWMYRNHPGERANGVLPNPTELVRVPADTVMHVYEPERPGQLRGVGMYATVAAKIRGVGDFDAAVLTRQQIANLFAMFITQAAPTGGDHILAPPPGAPSDASAIPLEPGISHTLLPGEGVEFADPPDSGANYAEYMRQQHLGISAGTGVPYELATGDAENISDRSLRILIQEFRRSCEQQQWLIYIPMLCERVMDAWITACVLAGGISPAEVEDARNVRWSPQGWDYIHPLQDVNAKVLEIQHKLRSRSSVQAARGDDPDEVAQEQADDMARDERYGLNVAPSAPPPAQDATPNEPQNEPPRKMATK